MPDEADMRDGDGLLMTTYGRTIVVVSSALHISRRDALLGYTAFWARTVGGAG